MKLAQGWVARVKEKGTAGGTTLLAYHKLGTWILPYHGYHDILINVLSKVFLFGIKYQVK